MEVSPQMRYNKLKESSQGGEDMNMKKYKLFWKLGDLDKHIIYKSFDDEEEYYSFLKQQFDAGYRQIIVSSEAMIDLIKYVVMQQGLKIYRIEFAEEDDALSEEVSNLIEMIETRPVMFNALIEKLHFLAETSSIDIKRIYLSGRLANGSIVDMYIQSNGIIAINDGIDMEFVYQIITLIERCLFG